VYVNALQAAAGNIGHQAVVQLLLDNRAEVNAQGGEHGNALQAAAHEGDQAVVQLLLDNGAEVNAQGGHLGNALQAAAAYKGD
jgi:ankyrin repeat protein